jgi:hypothetical protein
MTSTCTLFGLGNSEVTVINDKATTTKYRMRYSGIKVTGCCDCTPIFSFSIPKFNVVFQLSCPSQTSMPVRIQADILVQVALAMVLLLLVDLFNSVSLLAMDKHGSYCDAHAVDVCPWSTAKWPMPKLYPKCQLQL